jgi:lycopene cyclase domain-containing protein
MTYALLSLAFLLGALGVLAAAVALRGGHRIRPLLVPCLLAALALFVLTAVFDNVMIAVGIMQYSSDAISGLWIGLAPLEDFAYPLAAVILLPSLWVLLDRGAADER